MRPWPTFMVACLAVACAGEDSRYQPLEAGDSVPAYGARSLAGDSVDLADLQGRPVLLNIWATWCAPCREELPELQELAERFDGRLEVVGVSIDQAGSRDRIEAFLDEVGVDFRILLDPSERVVRSFRTIGVPESFLIDGEGVLRRRWIGSFRPLEEANLEAVEGVVGGVS